MTINELNTSKWQEFVFDLVEAKRQAIKEAPFQEKIEAGFRALGWSKANGEICPKERINIGNNNQLEPDITFKIGGRPVFVVEVKHPTNILTTRQIEQLLSYMRMRKVPFGLYIGEEIHLFFDHENELPTSVMKIDLDTEATNGWKFIDFFARPVFTSERIIAYCGERYKEIHSNSILDEFAEELQGNANDTIMNILQDYFVKTKKCDTSVVKKILEMYFFHVSKSTEEIQKDNVVEAEPSSRYVLQKQGRSHSKSRDTSKFSLDDGVNYFGKGKFVREVVAAYLSAHPSITFEQLEQVFPDELQGSYGVVRRLDELEKSAHDPKDLRTRYVMDEDKILCTKDGIRFVVSNQWGRFNFPHILELLGKWNWNVIKDKK